MKYIVAVIQPDRLDEVLKRLTDEEIHLVTVSSVVGRGRQKGVAQVYRSHKEQGSLLKKTKLEIAVNEAFVEKTVKAVTEVPAPAKSVTARSSSSIYKNVSASAPVSGAAWQSVDRHPRTECQTKEMRNDATRSFGPVPKNGAEVVGIKLVDAYCAKRVFAAHRVQLALGCGRGLRLPAYSAGDCRTAQASPLIMLTVDDAAMSRSMTFLSVPPPEL